MAYFPFLADIEGKKRLIAGGGGVSLRKVRDLLPYGAIIRAVSTNLSAGLLELGTDPVYGGRLILSRQAFKSRNLLDAGFAIAATSDQTLNSHISAVYHGREIPVNIVDVKEECPFIFPSIVQDGPMMVGISTRNASPVIAEYLRVRISQILPDNLGDLTQQLGGCRGRIKALFLHSPGVRPGLSYELAKRGLENGCRLTPEQAEVIINRKLEQEHE